MKIRNTILLLTVSAVAAVSCNLFKPLDMDIDIPVDKSAETSSAALIGIEEENHLTVDPNGDLILSFESGNSLSKSVSLSSTPQEVGTLEISLADKPSISNGSEISNGQIVVEVDNPSDSPMLVRGTLSAATKAAKTASFEFTVPAKTLKYKVLLQKAGTTELQEAVDAKFNFSSDAGDVLNNSIVESNVKIAYSAGLASTKAGAAPAASNVTVNIATKLLFGMSFKKGSTFKVVKKFSDMGLNLADYTVKSKEYDVHADVTNSMPFEISATGESVQNITASTDNPVAPGTKAAPVKTSVIISVKDNSSNSVIEDAIVTLQFKAASDGAKINAKDGLKIAYKSIKVHQI